MKFTSAYEYSKSEVVFVDLIILISKVKWLSIDEQLFGSYKGTLQEWVRRVGVTLLSDQF